MLNPDTLLLKTDGRQFRYRCEWDPCDNFSIPCLQISNADSCLLLWDFNQNIGTYLPQGPTH